MFVFLFRIIGRTALLGQNNTQPMWSNKAKSAVYHHFIFNKLSMVFINIIL